MEPFASTSYSRVGSRSQPGSRGGRSTCRTQRTALYFVFCCIGVICPDFNLFRSLSGKFTTLLRKKALTPQKVRASSTNGQQLCAHHCFFVLYSITDAVNDTGRQNIHKILKSNDTEFSDKTLKGMCLHVCMNKVI